MQKIISGIIFLAVFAFLEHALLASTAFAQEKEEIGVEIPGFSTESTVSSKVNYELPYPGMLPDNPFYFLKVARDTIVKALINDSFKKAQFSLLTGQKRLYAGKMLIDKGNTNLANETIAKSNNYLHEALGAIEDAKKENPKSPDIRPFLDQFRTVTLKHTEILDELIKRVDGNEKEKLTEERKKVHDIKNKVEGHLEQK